MPLELRTVLSPDLGPENGNSAEGQTRPSLKNGYPEVLGSLNTTTQIQFNFYFSEFLNDDAEIFRASLVLALHQHPGSLDNSSLPAYTMLIPTGPNPRLRALLCLPSSLLRQTPVLVVRGVATEL